MNIFRVFDQESKGCINVNELKNIWNNYLKEDIPSDSVSVCMKCGWHCEIAG